MTKPDIGVTGSRTAVVRARGVAYKIAVLDDGLATDPTLLIFREDEEVAILTLHLDPDAACLGEEFHMTAPREALPA